MLRILVLSLAVLYCSADKQPLIGGITQLTSNGEPPEFGRAYKKAKMNLIPIDFQEVTQQLVSGMKYHVKYSAGPLHCFKSNGYSEEEDCKSQKHVCEFSYVVQSWKKEPVTLIGDPKKTPFCKVSPPSYEPYDVNSDPDLVETPFNRTTDLDAKDKFDQFIVDYDRSYSPLSNDGMYWKRFTVFKKNLNVIKSLQKNEMGSAKYGITQFTDYTPTEYKRFLAGLRGKELEKPRLVDVPVIEARPTSFDWRDHGAVTEVKNQGQCGSCWAFSTTGNIEGQWAIKKQKLVSLSEQELVDCDKTDQGCNGGLPSNAYKSIEKLGGLETESEYPYDGRGESCHFKSSDVAVYINDSISLPTDEDKLASWLYKNGPISIGINAFAMQFYFGGVSHPWKFLCSPSSLDHGVLIVGYGETDQGEPFWIIKNSWGPSWGEHGYYRIYRGDGSCGVNKMATSAVVE